MKRGWLSLHSVYNRVGYLSSGMSPLLQNPDIASYPELLFVIAENQVMHSQV